MSRHFISWEWHRAAQSVVVSVNDAEVPTDDDWNEYLDVIRTALNRHGNDIARVGALALSDSTGPSASQRKRLIDVLGGRPGKAAIVTDSTGGLRTVTALSWFNPQVRAFAPEKVMGALAHLDVPRAHHAELLASVHKLAHQLGSLSFIDRLRLDV